MKEIKIHSKKHGDTIALVDDEDFEYLNQWKWSIEKSKNSCFYLYRTQDHKKIKMHKEICGYNITDHIDGNGLNNQKK
jgi:hypothetical protein